VGAIILASGSKARVGLLKAAGLDFTARAAPVDERAVEAPLLKAGAGAPAIATALADAKALAVSLTSPDALVIGADQVLDFQGEHWTKPASTAEARVQLRRLAGATHRLISAVALARGGSIVWRCAEEARLTMRALSDAEIDAYLARTGDAALASVGAYQLEGLGIQLFATIAGDYFAILGLPLLPLLAELRREGALSLAHEGS
jgi:septum formation protein